MFFTDVKQWCEDDNSLYYFNTCYFLTEDHPSNTARRPDTSCNNHYDGAVPVEVTSSSLQNNLMTFIRSKQKSISDWENYRTGGRYDVSNVFFC